MATVAFPYPSIFQVSHMVRIAFRAPHNTIGPTDLHHVAFAVLVIVEKLYRFQQRFGRMIDVRHGQNSTLNYVVCQVLYLI